MNVVTGTMYLRDKGQREGKRLAMLMMVVALPEDHGLDFERLYAITGELDADVLTLEIPREPNLDVSADVSPGARVDQIFCSPIWRT